MNSVAKCNDQGKIDLAFNYSALSAEIRNTVQATTQEIRDRLRRAAQDICEIGQRLIAVKDSLPHGQFGHWLKAEFDLTERTAEHWMSMALAFKSETVADLPITQRALYALASKTTPPEIRSKYIEQAQSGLVVRYEDVRADISAAHDRERWQTETELRRLKDSSEITSREYDDARYRVGRGRKVDLAELVATSKAKKSSKGQAKNIVQSEPALPVAISIDPKAVPIRGHSQPNPMWAINLPHDVEAAANALIGICGERFAVEVANKMLEASSRAVPAGGNGQPASTRRGRGMQHAYDAIACLQKIVPGDASRSDAMHLVGRWINDNGGIDVAVPGAAIRAAVAAIYEAAKPGNDHSGLMGAIAELREALSGLAEGGGR